MEASSDALPFNNLYVKVIARVNIHADRQQISELKSRNPPHVHGDVFESNGSLITSVLSIAPISVRPYLGQCSPKFSMFYNKTRQG